MSFEESLVLNASPTLASIKTANLYNFRFSSMKECLDTIRKFNELMNGKGIYIELLKNQGDFYLIYVYRKNHLQRELADVKIQDFLVEFGYPHKAGMQNYIEVLKRRINLKDSFPHEIGVFLGYPLEDVKSFIATEGSHCVFCGEWKVYHNEEAAKCLFCKYRHCKEVYAKVYKAGRKFSDMLVSA